MPNALGSGIAKANFVNENANVLVDATISPHPNMGIDFAREETVEAVEITGGVALLVGTESCTSALIVSAKSQPRWHRHHL